LEIGGSFTQELSVQPDGVDKLCRSQRNAGDCNCATHKSTVLYKSLPELFPLARSTFLSVPGQARGGM